MLDVAGIGSTLQEHIKIFAGILEDAWIGSRKDIGYTAAAGTAPAEVLATPAANIAPKRPELAVAPKGPGQASLKPTATQAPMKHARSRATRRKTRAHCTCKTPEAPPGGSPRAGNLCT